MKRISMLLEEWDVNSKRGHPVFTGATLASSHFEHDELISLPEAARPFLQDSEWLVDRAASGREDRLVVRAFPERVHWWDRDVEPWYFDIIIRLHTAGFKMSVKAGIADPKISLEWRLLAVRPSGRRLTAPKQAAIVHAHYKELAIGEVLSRGYMDRAFPLWLSELRDCQGKEGIVDGARICSPVKVGA